MKFCHIWFLSHGLTHSWYVALEKHTRKCPADVWLALIIKFLWSRHCNTSNIKMALTRAQDVPLHSRITVTELQHWSVILSLLLFDNRSKTPSMALRRTLGPSSPPSASHLPFAIIILLLFAIIIPESSWVPQLFLSRFLCVRAPRRFFLACWRLEDEALAKPFQQLHVLAAGSERFSAEWAAPRTTKPCEPCEWTPPALWWQRPEPEHLQRKRKTTSQVKLVHEPGNVSILKTYAFVPTRHRSVKFAQETANAVPGLNSISYW